LKPNKNGIYCRRNDCAYGRRNLVKLTESKPFIEDISVPEPVKESVPEPVKESVAESECQDIKKTCEDYDDIIERIKKYKKEKIKNFIRKVYESVDKKLDEYY